MITENGDILTHENIVTNMNDMLLFLSISPDWKTNPQSESVKKSIHDKMLEIGTNMSVVH